jgi:hypothetical protein
VPGDRDKNLYIVLLVYGASTHETTSTSLRAKIHISDKGCIKLINDYCYNMLHWIAQRNYDKIFQPVRLKVCEWLEIES